MNTKKIIGIIVTAVAVIFTGITGVVSAIMLNESTVGIGEFLLGSASSEIASIASSDVELIYINGTIQNVDMTFQNTLNGLTYDHNGTLNKIESLADSATNKGILLHLDTPGGGVYESDEVYLALMEYKEKTGRPVFAFMGSMAASGGYYIACAADYIIANRNCWTGSLGVVVSYQDVSGLYEKLGIETHEYTSGPFKTTAPEELSEEEAAIYQSLVDEAYDQFVGIIATGRDMTDSEVRKLADGRLYTAKQALENGLIDEIGDYDYMVQYIYDTIGETVSYSPIVSDDFFNLFASTLSGLAPKSEAEILTEILESTEPLEIMYVLQS